MDGKKILFSIIVPAYQVEQYLSNCIESIINQAVEEIEVIIIDDGSKDNTGKIADEYALRNEKVCVIHQENEGQSAARNKGIKKARGKYLVFVDSDDYLCQEALINLKSCIMENNYPELIVSRRKSIDSQNRETECRYFFSNELNSLSSTQIFTSLQKMKDMLFAPWIFTVDRTYFLENEFFFPYGIYHEDEEWVPKIILNAKRISFNNSLLYCYRKNREGSTMNVLNIKKIFDKLEVINLLQREFEKDKYTFEQKSVVKKRISSIYFGLICKIYNYREDERYKEAIIKLYQKRNILNDSTKKAHRVCYIMLKIFGIKMTSYIFNILTERK